MGAPLNFFHQLLRDSKLSRWLFKITRSTPHPKQSSNEAISRPRVLVQWFHVHISVFFSQIKSIRPNPYLGWALRCYLHRVWVRLEVLVKLAERSADDRVIALGHITRVSQKLESRHEPLLCSQLVQVS